MVCELKVFMEKAVARLLPLVLQSSGGFWEDALSVLVARERARVGLAASEYPHKLADRIY